MPLSAPASREDMHTRQLTCKGYRRRDGLWDIEGHLIDHKPYAFETKWRGHMPPGRPIHEMWLRITVDEDLMIHASEAAMDHNPYDACPGSLDNFRKLAGIRIGPGFMREVKARVGATLGCTHLVEMIRPLATTAFQTLVASEKHMAKQEIAVEGRPPNVLNTCFAHSDTSPITKERWPAFYVGP